MPPLAATKMPACPRPTAVPPLPPSLHPLVGPLHLAYRELGGVRGVVSLLQAALASRPAVKELPRDAEATEAASIAVRLCPLVFLILRWG